MAADEINDVRTSSKDEKPTTVSRVTEHAEQRGYYVDYSVLLYVIAAGGYCPCVAKPDSRHKCPCIFCDDMVSKNNSCMCGLFSNTPIQEDM